MSTSRCSQTAKGDHDSFPLFISILYSVYTGTDGIGTTRE